MGAICCVCEKPIEDEVIQMGGRPYCTTCHEKVSRNRQSLWWASIAGVGALAVFTVVVAFLVNLTHPQLTGNSLIVAGSVLAIVPAILWLAVFYIQDVREPEPKQLVFGVFILGIIVAKAVGIPLVEDVFHVSDWISAGTMYNILGSILIVGFVHQFLVYATVRYSIYNADEFDERMDGIVYAVAAALGYATLLNIQYVVQSGGVDLTAGVIRITVTAMALASFGGLLGYFLGRCKFEDEPAWWMPAGLILAAVLDGLFTYLRGEITTTAVGLQGGGYNPWPGLVLGTVVAIATFAFLFYLIQRLQKRAPQAVGA